MVKVSICILSLVRRFVFPVGVQAKCFPMLFATESALYCHLMVSGGSDTVKVVFAFGLLINCEKNFSEAHGVIRSR